MIKTLKLKSVLVLFALIGSATMFAQEQEVTDTELTQFANAYVKMQMQNQEAQQKVMKLIQDKGLALERFNEIQQASMDPNTTVDATAEEMKQHAEITAEIEKMQPKMEEQAIKGIESTGISLDQYQALGAAIQKDEALQKRLQDILMKAQGN